MLVHTHHTSGKKYVDLEVRHSIRHFGLVQSRTFAIGKCKRGTIGVAPDPLDLFTGITEFEVPLRELEEAIDQFLDGKQSVTIAVNVDEAEGLNNPVIQLQRHDDAHVRIVAMCGMIFYCKFEDLDTLYGLMPKL